MYKKKIIKNEIETYILENLWLKLCILLQLTKNFLFIKKKEIYHLSIVHRLVLQLPASCSEKQCLPG